MISPTPRAIFLMLLGAPLLVAIALLRPEWWIVCAGWIGAISGLMLIDAVMSASLRAFRVEIESPPLLYVGGSFGAEQVGLWSRTRL